MFNQYGRWLPNLRDFLKLTNKTSKLDKETRICYLGDLARQTMLQFHESLRNDFQLPSNWTAHNSRLLQLDVLEYWGPRTMYGSHVYTENFTASRSLKR